jgi:formamidopyrimidine-DNA glycosylase
MPELPEVETIRSCITAKVAGQQISRVIVRNSRLRWPVSRHLAASLAGRTVLAVERRAKYLLFRCNDGCLIIHLGMSGTLTFLPEITPPLKHDHLDLVFGDDSCLRFNDPRRFGAVLWTSGDPLTHPLLEGLGPEPLGNGLSGSYLFRRSRHRTVAVKQFIMDNHIVVGIGNIYANEALFAAGIHPAREAGQVSLKRYQRLAEAIRQVLAAALRAGGTTLRDFCDASGNPGYFQLELKVYGRANQPCPGCGLPIKQLRQGQRSSFFCGRCQR